MQKQILSGCEAVARGAWEAGVRVAAAYPGTPSTEILENLGEFASDPPVPYAEGDGLYATWANNEAIAVEIALGASIGGSRALVAMKHVGMNVAADPIFSGAYAGVNAGLVIVSCDDPGCYSSQNEQDNRLYAPHAKLIMLEPSDSQETLDFVKAAFKISETYDLPVMIRMTTRVCHSKSIVTTGERVPVAPRKYDGDWTKYVELPQNARKRHVIVEKNLRQLSEDTVNFSEWSSSFVPPYQVVSSDLSDQHKDEKPIIVITSGMAYQHAREAFGENVSYIKYNVTFPIGNHIYVHYTKDYLFNYRVYVIEEGEPYLANSFKAMGVDVYAPSFIQGELNAERIRQEFPIRNNTESIEYKGSVEAPPRPPVLCAGCPHRGFFYALSRRKGKYVGVGDIGCYTLGVSAPFNGMDICICMGSGFSIPIGLSKALEAQGDTRKVIGMCGDSTFFHSGFNSLVDAVHQKANVCLVVLDNSITAMTGHQENAGTERNLMGYEVPKVSIEDMILATGLPKERLISVNPIDQQAMGNAIDQAIANEKGVTVIVTHYPCALLKEVVKARGTKHCEVDPEKCVGCKACQKVACPAMAFNESNKKAYVADTRNCTACGLCAQTCKLDAISEVQ